MRRRMLLALSLVLGVLVFSGSASASGTLDLLDFESTVEEMQAVDPTLEPPPTGGKHDFVVGGYQQFIPNYAVSARSGPTGEDPQGHVSVTFPEQPEFTNFPVPLPFKYRARVTCVNVVSVPVGERLVRLAAVELAPMDTASNDLAATWVFFFRDAGPGGGEGEDPIELDGHWQSTPHVLNPGLCRDAKIVASQALAAPPIERGNILIHDAQP